MIHLKLSQFVPEGHFFHYARVPFFDAVARNFHDHDFYEVFWVEEGRGHHKINGEVRPLNSGNLILVHNSDVHALSAADGVNMRISNVAFSRTYWQKLWARYFPSEKDPMLRKHSDREFSPSSEEQVTLHRASLRLENSTRSRIHFDHFLLELFCQLQPSAPLPHGSKEQTAPQWLLQAMHRIQEPEELRGGTATFARLAGRSADHVTRVTKQFFDRIPTEIVTKARMNYAASRLALTEETILDIADACGLPNLAHFYKLFAAHHGTTPNAYRKKARQIVSG